MKGDGNDPGLSGKCPSCNADQLIWGTILLPLNETLRFMPHSLPARLTGLPLEAFACRSCGYVGLRLSLEPRKILEQTPHWVRRIRIETPLQFLGPVQRAVADLLQCRQRSPVQFLPPGWV